MPDQLQNQPEATEEERHQRVKEDFLGLSKFIPNDLRARLELLLSDPRARQAVLELQLLAIQYGRGLERMDMGLLEGPTESQIAQAMREVYRKPAMKREHGAPYGSTPLVDVASQSQPIDPKAIIVVPGFAFDSRGKKH